MIHPCNRVWSLLEMLKAYAANYVKVAKILSTLEQLYEESVAAGTANQPMSPQMTKKMQRLKLQMDELSYDLPLPMFDKQLDRASAMIADRETDTVLSGAIKDIRLRLEDELEIHKFLYVSPDKAKYYGARFEPQVDDKFPESISEIESAGKCLALSLSTAVVFHLMRAMELAVQALTAKLGFTNLDRVWGNLLSDMKQAIEAMQKGPERDRWSESHSLLYSVKQAWRNDTMHPKQSYSDEEAEEIYLAVRIFMRHLATLV